MKILIGCEGRRAEVEDFILANGREYKVAETGLTGEPNQCFANCQQYVACEGFMKGCKLRYCEGWVDTGGPFLLYHAWLVDDEGNAYDPTLGTKYADCAYYGVEFDTGYIRKTAAKTGMWHCLIDNELTDWEILEGLEEAA